jgi:tetratricopeptide (TPR) repeat protein
MDDPDDVPASVPAPAGAEPSAPAAPKPLPKAPRVNTILADRKDSAGPKVSLDDLINFLRRFEGAPGSQPGAGAQQPNVSKEQRKFRKFDAAAAKPAQPPPGAAGGEASAAPIDPATDNPEGLKAAGAARADDGSIVTGVTFKGARKPKVQTRNALLGFLMQGVALLLMVACFFLGRVTVTPGALKPAPARAAADQPPKAMSPADMNQLDQGIAAESAGDARKAAAIFERLRHGATHINGLDYQSAWLAYQMGDMESAHTLLDRSIVEGENVGESYDLRGLIANQRQARHGLHDLEAATQTDPFDAGGFFHWGEALRRLGKPQEALVHLIQAAERADSPAARATYLLKARLTQIELGQQEQFAHELAAEMALPKPPVEWVLTAAAQDMHNGDYPAAVADLNRARQLMDPSQLALELRDYFFMEYADKEALKGIYAEILGPPAAGRPARTPAQTAPIAPTPADGLPATLSAPAVPEASAAPPFGQ